MKVQAEKEYNIPNRLVSRDRKIEKVNLKVKIEIAKSRLWTARSQNRQVCHNPDPLLELQADLEIFYNGILI